MNNNIIAKATAVVLGAGVAAMLAAGSASAAAPAATPRIAHTSHVAGTAGTRTITLVNMTPYEWTLDSATNYNNFLNASNWPDALAPTQTLEPGQREDIQTLNDAGQYGTMYIQYNFTDANGGPHIVKFQTQPSEVNWGEGIVICAADGTDASSVASNTFNMVKYNPDSDPVTIAAGMDGPTDATVDARLEPARAAAIMQQFGAGPDQSYTPTSDVTFTPHTESTPAERVTGKFINGSSEKATITLTHSLQTSQSTSLGAEVGADAEFNILGLVNGDASVSAQTSQSFGADTTMSGTAGIVLQPAGSTTNESKGWITRKSDNAVVTGDFNFTTGGGLIIYHVKNVTVNASAVSGSKLPTNYAVVYGQEWDTKPSALPAG